MSQNEQLFKKAIRGTRGGFSENSRMNKSLSRNLDKLTDNLDEITEYDRSTLISISILETDILFKPYLETFEKKKKHLKRKHAQEILTAYKYLAGNMSERSFLSKILHFKFGNSGD